MEGISNSNLGYPSKGGVGQVGKEMTNRARFASCALE
jgi:hypothetical protein